MTDSDKAEEYVDTLLNKDDAEINKFLDENLGDLQLNERQAGTLLGIIKGIGICSFIAGLEADKDMAEADIATIAYMQGAERYKTKWHDLRNDPNDLPLNADPILCLGSTGFIVCKYISGSWVDNQKIELIPKYIDIYKWCKIEDTEE